VVLSSSGLLYFVQDDHIKSAIMSVDGKQIGKADVIAGSSQQAGSDNGVGTAASFRSPSDVDLSPDGRALYVCDTGNHQVRAAKGRLRSMF